MKIPHIHSRETLRLVASIIWLSGGIVLLVKGSSLIAQAEALRPGAFWTWMAIPAGMLIGGIKAELIFERACRRNLDRIESLDVPKVWLAYRPRFYFFLAAMVFLGGTLSALAKGSYGGLFAVAVLDFSLATALLGSSRLFWTHRQQHRTEADDKER